MEEQKDHLVLDKRRAVLLLCGLFVIWGGCVLVTSVGHTTGALHWVMISGAILFTLGWVDSVSPIVV